LRVAFEVAHEAAIAADPRQCSFDDPAFEQDDEAVVQLVSLDDLEVRGAALCDGSSRFHTLVAGIGKDALDKREEASRAVIEDEPHTNAILHVGRMDDDIQQEAERVDENVAFAARDPLARIEALLVERRAPFERLSRSGCR
jgi:hypothetical protein